MDKISKGKIEEIMNNFNFKKVHEVMVYTRWKWSDGSGKDKIPTLKQLEDQARRMLIDAVDGCAYSTGGFEVEFKGNLLSLKFVFENYWS